MGDEFPGGLGADLGWNSPLPAGPFDSVPTGVGAASCHRGALARASVCWTPIFSLPVLCRFRAQALGLGARSCRCGWCG